MADSRFPTALQIVISVAVNGEVGTRTTSGSLASALDTNPSFVRKTVAELVKANILASTEGVMGGLRLAMPPQKITLAMIREVAVPDPRLWVARDNIPAVCVITRNIGRLSERVCAQASDAVVGVLDCITVRQCIDNLFELDGVQEAVANA